MSLIATVLLVWLVGLPAAIVAIVVLLVAGGAAVGSSAVLTTSSSNPGNSFQAANLSVTNDANGALFTVSGLKPSGGTDAPGGVNPVQPQATAPITISNDGN